jgi:hypothetical protein
MLFAPSEHRALSWQTPTSAIRKCFYATGAQTNHQYNHRDSFMSFHYTQYERRYKGVFKSFFVTFFVSSQSVKRMVAPWDTASAKTVDAFEASSRFPFE